MECISEKNKVNCTCTYTACTKRGLCCQCVAYHRSKNEIPGCLFSTAGEKTYDRSVANYLKDKQN